MNHTTAIELMLKNLDEWRHLPKYQLERRADLFFGLFIRDLISDRFKTVHKIFIPEFPFRNNIDTSTTVNFDYVLFSEDCSIVYIIELKTDPNSFRIKQEDYLKQVKKTNFMENIKDFQDVYAATKQKGKYSHLLDRLVELGFIAWLEKGRSFQLLSTAPNPEIQIVYLTPKLNDKRLKAISDYAEVILFDEIADFLQNKGPVEALFAYYLRQWDQITAGARND